MPSATPRLRLRSALVVAAAGISLALNVRLDEPPRYDGAGYAVLARSLLQGSGYREIDHPDAPRHAHFPPGYPLALAGLWAITGPSAPAAHGLSIACTLAAVWLATRLLAAWYRPSVALGLGLALAINWRWARDGSAIQSESLFLAIGLAAVLASGWVARRRGWWRAVALGATLGVGVLVRHVGICLVAAILADLTLNKRAREALVSAGIAAAVVAPWVVWMAKVGHRTQVGLLPGRDWPWVVAENAVFYARRLPDQVVGPIVEVATVFRPSWAATATIGAAIASASLFWGWTCCLRAPRRRIAGLIPLATLGLLLSWPFTEAGRFLVPLIPFVLVGAAEAAGRILARLGTRRPRAWAAALLLAASLPYSVYAIARGRSEAGRRSHLAFDRACAWIAHQQDSPGPVLSRHPGEVFLRSGRKSLAPPDDAPPEVVAGLIRRYRVAFLLIDEDRYARAPTGPLQAFVAAHAGRVERAHDGGSVVVYRIKPG